MNIEHPYAPDIQWRFAVSRRFTSSYVDALYKEYIHGVLCTEGTVLECYYAAETPESEDYWVNRMNLILELSDIHILVDIEPSTYTVYEIEKSVRERRRQMRTTLPKNFGERISNILVVKESESIQPISRSRRTTTIYLSKKVSQDEFHQHFRNEIDAAKLLKCQDFVRREKWAKRLTPGILKLLGEEVPLSPPADRKDWLRAYQSIASLIASGKPIDEINLAIQESLKVPVNQLAGAIEDFAQLQHGVPKAFAGIEPDYSQLSAGDAYEDSISTEDAFEPRPLIDAQVAFNLKIKQEELRSPKKLKELFSIYKYYYSEYIPNLLWAFISLDPSDNKFVSGLTKGVVVSCALVRTIQAKLFRLRFSKRKS